MWHGCCSWAQLGGFHFNDRKYADDDLTLGSIDPYQVFRIFHEIVSATPEEREGIAFMIDQSHNLKGKMEAMVQSVMTAQELYAKASLIDQEKLAELQDACRLVEAEECFRTAFWQDVRPVVREWRVGARLAGGSAEGAGRERVRGEDDAGARQQERPQRFQLRLRRRERAG